MLNTYTKSRPSGFSLVELMIALVIMGILLALAMPSFRAMLLNSQIRNAAESIQNGLQRARAEAVIRNTTTVTFTLLPAVANDATSWTIVENTVPAATTIETRLSNEGSRDVIRTVTPAGAAMVTFDNTGRPVANPDGSVTLSSVGLDVPVSLLSAAESQDLLVTINFDGLIRMCDPHVSATNPRAC